MTTAATIADDEGTDDQQAGAGCAVSPTVAGAAGAVVAVNHRRNRQDPTLQLLRPARVRPARSRRPRAGRLRIRRPRRRLPRARPPRRRHLGVDLGSTSTGESALLAIERVGRRHLGLDLLAHLTGVLGIVAGAVVLDARTAGRLARDARGSGRFARRRYSQRSLIGRHAVPGASRTVVMILSWQTISRKTSVRALRFHDHSLLNTPETAQRIEQILPEAYFLPYSPILELHRLRFKSEQRFGQRRRRRPNRSHFARRCLPGNWARVGRVHAQRATNL